MKEKCLAGKVALVTGAINGIGAAVVRALAREGATVVASHYRRDKQAESTMIADVRHAAGDVAFCQLDVCDESSWQRTMEIIRDSHGRLDILVNNAGRPAPEDIEAVTFKEWRQTMAVNLDGVFLGIQYGIAAIKQHGEGGAVINIGSVMGLMADDSQIAYSASKAGMRMLSRAAALHCAKAGYGIRVNSLCPGFTQTPMLERFLAAQGDLQKGLRAVSAKTPLGRLGTPDELAEAVIFLSSPVASFATGIDLTIDGGLSLQAT